jgi:Domain of unknown function (DUF5666)
MFIARQFFRAVPLAVAILAAACNGTPGSAGNPASPSSSGSPGSQASSGLTAAQSAAAAAACGVQLGDDGSVTVTVGTPPPGAPPPHTVEGPDPNPPSGPPPAGAQVMLGGSIEGVAGSCPSLSLTMHGTTVQTNRATTFGSGTTCASLKAGAHAAAFGTVQANGSLLASCIAGI